MGRTYTQIISRQCRERRTDRISQIFSDYKPDTTFIGYSRHAVAVISDDGKTQISKMAADVGDSGLTGRKGTLAMTQASL